MYGSGINNIRFGGLVSGMDTEKIIQDLVKVQRLKVDRVEREKIRLEWKRDDYRDINTKLLALRNSTFDMKLQGTFMSRTVSSSDEKILKATATAGTAAGVYNITVKQLASGATRTSSSSLGSVAAEGQDRRVLKDQLPGIADEVTFTLKGQKGTQMFRIDTAEASIYDVARAINEAGIGVQASYDSTLDRFFLMSEGTGSEAEISILEDGQGFLNSTLQLNTGSLSSNGMVGSAATDTLASLGVSADTFNFTLRGDQGSVQFSDISNQTTLQELVDTINARSGETGISAEYVEDAAGNFLLLRSTADGGPVEISSDEQNVLRGALKLQASTARGRNALFDFNDAHNIESSSNEASVNGVNLSLKGTGQAHITVTTDLDAVVDRIKAFVEDYNAVMEKMSTRLYEKRFRDFSPLTQEEKAGMSDKDIELWEEKARSGLLNSDSLLRDSYSSIRLAAMGAVDGADTDFKALSTIGIATTSWYEQGKLEVNESKLREALSKDPEGVMKLFTHSSEEAGQKGIAQRLYDTVDEVMGKFTEKAGRAGTKIDQSYLGKEIDRTQDRLEDMQERLFEVENRYWQKFSAMERALQQMQSQSSWLMSQLGMGGQ